MCDKHLKGPTAQPLGFVQFSLITTFFVILAAVPLADAEVAIKTAPSIEKTVVTGGLQATQIEVLPNGGIWVGAATNIALLSSDFHVDPTFKSAHAARAPFGVLPDGQIIATSSNPVFGTNSYPCVVKLKPDGSIDPNFNAPQVWSHDTDRFYTIAPQTDGKILIGWERPVDPRPSFAGALPFNFGLFRLNSDGSLDGTFTNPSQIAPMAIVALPNGQTLIGGFYRRRLARISQSGAVDSAFNVTVGQTDSDYVASIALQPDGKAIITGLFFQVNGSSRSSARVDANGFLDPTFNPPVRGYTVRLQSDGRIVFGWQGLWRVFSNGVPDQSFWTDRFSVANLGLAIDGDGRILTTTIADPSREDGITVYSGQFRVNIAPGTSPLILEKSSSLDGPWSILKTIPAGTPDTYPDYSFPASGNAFFRARPAQ